MTTTTEKRKVGWKNIIAWGSGDIFGSGAGTIIGLWMLYFYTQVAGLSPIEAGLIFAIAKGMGWFYRSNCGLYYG